MSFTLKAFPDQKIINQYDVMNAVATTMFIHAESLMHLGKNDESIAAYFKPLADAVVGLKCKGLKLV